MKEDNKKILAMNTKIYLLDLKRKKLEEEEDKVNENISNIEEEINHLYTKAGKNFSIFTLTILAELIYILITSTTDYSLPFFNIPLVVGTLVGSMSFNKHRGYKDDIGAFTYEKDYQKSQLSRIHVEIKNLERLKIQTKEMLCDESNEHRLDDIVTLLEKNSYRVEDVEKELKNKPKTKVLSLEN